ncbi:MAG: hypothetical protein FJ308_02720 [Planctomycetes bacterium]|nr:hypothetical protein [Planctomycetota bacterium]
MSKPFNSWVRLAIVVSLSIFTPFNTAFAERWMERWMHRPSCRSVPFCESGIGELGIAPAAVSVVDFDACGGCGSVVMPRSSSTGCCDCIPSSPSSEGVASDESGASPPPGAPGLESEKSVPWTRIEPATPAEKPSVAPPEPEVPVAPKVKDQAAAAPSAPTAPVPIVPSDGAMVEDEPEADEAKPRELAEKPEASEPDSVPETNEEPATPASEQPVTEQPEMEESDGKEGEPKDLVEPDRTEEANRDEKGNAKEPSSEPEPSIDDLFGDPKAPATDSEKPAADASKEADAEEAVKKIEESIDDLSGKPVNFGPSIDRVGPPAPRPSESENAPSGSKVKPTGSPAQDPKVRTEGTEKSGGKFRLNEGQPKKGKAAGIEDELDRIFRSKTFVPPAKFQGAEVRTWTDNTGAYSIEARVAVIFGDKVRLLKENGKYTTVPMERLSDFDRSYVQWVAESLTYRASKIVRNNSADELSPEMAR